MRILQLISTFYPALSFGGPTKSAYELSRELAKRGNKVEVFTTDAYDKKLNFRGVKNYTLDGFKVSYFHNTIRYGNIFVSIELLRSLKKHIREFEILHSHFGRQAHDTTLAIYGMRFCIPYVVQARGDLPRIMSLQTSKLIYDTFIGRKVLTNASKAIALSEEEAKQYADMGLLNEKIVIIPNGINLAEYRNLPSMGTFKEKFGLMSEQRMILFVGRLHKIKGLDTLISAFSKITRDFHDVKLVVIGPDDGYLLSCQELINKLGIGGNVLFTGPLFGRDKLAAFIDSEFLVCPSKYEIFGNVILESYACSRPAIASRVGGLKEIVFDHKTGLLFNPGNDEQLGAAMLSLLQDQKYCNELGRNARKEVEKKYSIESVVSKLEETYSEISKR